MRTAFLPLAALLAGCCTPPAPELRIVDTGCDWTRAIYVSKHDVLTDGTAEQIWSHNEAGKAKCGWTPKAKQP